MPSPAQVREARLKAGLTQSAAAELVYVDRVTWARWEGSKTASARPMPLSLWELFRHKAGLVRLPFEAR